MLVHPMHFSTEPEPLMIDRPLWTRESRYAKVLYEKFPAISGISARALTRWPHSRTKTKWSRRFPN
ncbi:DUF4765 family protein [Salmonella enterica subsp. enterica serovar Kentucky]|nr:DUF4765 family protein [Salmonella enterica subsp. enterica serovar Kentucky]